MRTTLLICILFALGCKPQGVTSNASSLGNLASDKKVTHNCGSKSFAKTHVNQIKGPAATSENKLTVLSALGNVPPEIQDGFFAGVEVWLYKDVAKACEGILTADEQAASAENNEVKACWDLKSTPHRILLGAEEAEIRHNAVRAVGFFQVNQALSFLVKHADDLKAEERRDVVEMINRVQALPAAFAKDTADTKLPAGFSALNTSQKEMVIYADAFDTVYCYKNPWRDEAKRFENTLRAFLGRAEGFGLQQGWRGNNNYGQIPSGFLKGRRVNAVDNEGNRGTRFVNPQTGFAAPNVLSHNDGWWERGYKRTHNISSYVGDVAGRAAVQTGQMARSVGSSLNPANWSWFQ